MRSLTTQSRMDRDVRERQGKVIESYCCGKDVFLSVPTGETLANWASPFGLFLRSSP